MVSSFSACLGYAHLSTLFDSFAPRILFGAPKELLELVCLHPILKQPYRARQLFALGLRSAQDLARAGPAALAKLLPQLSTFESVRQDFIKVGGQSFSASSPMWVHEGRELSFTEVAQTLVEAARSHLQQEIDPLGIGCLDSSSLVVPVANNKRFMHRVLLYLYSVHFLKKTLAECSGRNKRRASSANSLPF